MASFTHEQCDALRRLNSNVVNILNDQASDKDGNTYCVRETPKLELVADLLAEVTGKLKKLVAYMGEKYPDRSNVKQLVKNFNPKKISETLPTSSSTIQN